MLIFGVDPGSRSTGYGIIEAEGNRYHCLDYGVIHTQSGGEVSFSERLGVIHTDLHALLGKFRPDVVAVEEAFHAVNVKTALKLGQVRGVVLLAAAQHRIPVSEYSPLRVKQSVVGYGRAEKHQVQLMVKTLLNMSEPPQPHDAADALAIALCHAFNKLPDLHTRRRC